MLQKSLSKKQLIRKPSAPSPSGPRTMPEALSNKVAKPHEIGSARTLGVGINPFDVFDWYSDSTYKFVAPSHVGDYRAMGYAYYPASELAKDSGSGKPYMYFFEEIDGHVYVGQDVMMYNNKEVAERRRAENLERTNSRLQQPITDKQVRYSAQGEEATYSVDAERGIEEILLTNPEGENDEA